MNTHRWESQKLVWTEPFDQGEPLHVGFAGLVDEDHAEVQPEHNEDYAALYVAASERLERPYRGPRAATRHAVLTTAVFAVAGLVTGCTTGSNTPAPSTPTGRPAVDRQMQFGGYVAALDASTTLTDPTRRPTLNPGESAADFNTRAHTEALAKADPGATGNVVADAYYHLGAHNTSTSCVVITRAPGASQGSKPAWAWISVGFGQAPVGGGFAWIPVTTCKAAVAAIPSGDKPWTATMMPKGAILGTSDTVQALITAVPTNALTAKGRQFKS
jgi:hypothetical protein